MGPRESFHVGCGVYALETRFLLNCHGSVALLQTLPANKLIFVLPMKGFGTF